MEGKAEKGKKRRKTTRGNVWREGGWEGASWGGGVAEGREDLRLVNIYLFTGEMPAGPLAQVEALARLPPCPRPPTPLRTIFLAGRRGEGGSGI